MDIRKRIYKFPKMGVKAKMIAVTTTSGTGSEVTPFAVVTDDATGQKYPLADYALTPDMAIVDANLVMDMPKSLCAFGGLDAVTHAMEAYVSVLASEFSDGQALQALKLLKEYLPASYHEGSKNPVARERVHSAATIAGIAFANAFLGVCHSMAHKLGSQFHIPHGLANALLICNVIRYNANDNPTKQTAFSQYDRPQARRRYAEIADHLGLSAPGDRTAAKIEKLLAWLETLKAELGIPKSIREAGVQEADFLANVDKLSEDAFDDQCTGANPRYPLISELKQILLDTYYGRDYVEGETAAKKEAARLKLRKSEEIRLISSAVWQHKRSLLGPFFCFTQSNFPINRQHLPSSYLRRCITPTHSDIVLYRSQVNVTVKALCEGYSGVKELSRRVYTPDEVSKTN